jgi:hypothetical protein
MTEEHQSIMKNFVWEIVPRPKENSVVTSKRVYKIKHPADGSMDKYKARFVARGFSQKEGEDYDETFDLVARYTSIRAIMSLVTSVTHDFGHSGDVSTRTQAPTRTFCLRKVTVVFFQKHMFKMGLWVAYITGCENPPFSQATHTWGVNYSQSAL